MFVDDWKSSADKFDGFRVYSVDEDTGILPYFDVEHSSGNFDDGCWSHSAFVLSRSMVFGGDIMTFNGHSIMIHDLITGLPDAEPINLDEDLAGEDCWPHYTVFHGW